MTETFEADDIPLTSEEQLFAGASPGPQQPGNQPASESYGKKLRAQTIACRLRRSKWGINKKLDRAQVQQAAQQFHADTDRISAGKRLIDSNAEEYRACTATISSAVEYWKSVTVPFPEMGIRLIRKDRVEQFNQQIQALQEQLAENVDKLKAKLDELIERSRQQLGELFNAEDYPQASELDEMFSIERFYPAIQADKYLKDLDPALYQAEQARVQAQFDLAVKLAEDAFAEEFAKMVSKLAEQMTGLNDDGKPKMFFESSVSNLVDFFGRFKAMNIGSNEQLDALISEAQQIVQGDQNSIDAHAYSKQIRKDVTMRQHIGQKLGELSAKIETQLVTKPARKFMLSNLDVEDSA